MKKIIALLVAAMLLVCSLSACGSGTVSQQSAPAQKPAEESTESTESAEGTTQGQAATDAAEQTSDGAAEQAAADAAEQTAAGAAEQTAAGAAEQTTVGAAEQTAAASTEQAAAGVSGTAAETAPLSVVTTIFPEYDWVMNILGENPGNAEVSMLLDNGVDLHSFQPTAEDILKISNCDLFLYVGGESDEWAEDALAEGGSEDRVVLNLLKMLGDQVVEEELVEGMEEEEEEAGEGEEGEEEGPEYDEHVWLSLRNSSVLIEKIAEALSAADPANAQTYQDNAGAYKEELAALDAEYQKTVDGASGRTLLFGDRFPFRYMADDYGLEYYAAFAGCSAETEASFETIVFLAGKVDELSLGSVMTIEGANHQIAETVRDNTSSRDQQILTMDSMQSTTSKDVADGASYLSIMEKNLEVLKEALE